MAPRRLKLLLPVLVLAEASLPRGRWLEANSTGCWEAQDCGVGSFVDVDGACRKCKPGYYTPQAYMRQCLMCDAGRFANKAGASHCTSCPAGRFAPTRARTECHDCPAGRFAEQSRAIQCTPCPEGRFTEKVGNWTICQSCAPGSITDRAGHTKCKKCSPGRAAPESNSRKCDYCEIGYYSSVKGASECGACMHGSMQNLKGMTSCNKCTSWYWPWSSNPDRSNCETYLPALVAVVVVFLSYVKLFTLLGKVVRHRIPLQDVKLEVSQNKGRLIMTTHGPHFLTGRGISWRSAAVSSAVDEPRHLHATTTSFNIESSHVKLKRSWQVPVTIFGTGHTQLDADPKQEGWTFPAAAAATASLMLNIVEKVRPSYPEHQEEQPQFVVQAVTSQHLLLLSRDGHPETRALETSQGCLVVAFPSTLWAYCPLGVPLFLHLAALLTFATAPAFIFLPEFLNLYAFVAGLSLVASAIVAMFNSRRRTVTPLQLKLTRHQMDLKHAVPFPQENPRGPGRAVKGGQLWCFYDTFEPFIRSRTMHYVVANIIKPLTKEARLSYAEIAGPQQTQWFVSHFWGTSFSHFVRTICKHGESAASNVCAWQDIAYWICSLSNNQWKLQEELGTSWESSSFYLALSSPSCCGTAMVVDDNAMPLTRAWCLFEVLQTRLKENEADNFHGLWLCTSSGVLHEGRAGVDVAMRIAERLATLRLEDATASVAQDKHMIDELVSQMPGGFPAMNQFVRQKIYAALLAMRSSFSADFNSLLQSLHGNSSQTLLQSLRAHGSELDIAEQKF